MDGTTRAVHIYLYIERYDLEASSSAFVYRIHLYTRYEMVDSAKTHYLSHDRHPVQMDRTLEAKPVQEEVGGGLRIYQWADLQD
jgi:hypothetical protein